MPGSASHRAPVPKAMDAHPCFLALDDLLAAPAAHQQSYAEVLRVEALSVGVYELATPLGKKLALKHGHVVALLGAPNGRSIPELEPEVEVRRDLRRKPDIVVAFVRSRSELRQQAVRVVRALAADGSLWIAWPRKAGGHVSDVTEQSLRDQFLPTGLVDNKVAALDDDWSGLRFVWRRAHRASLDQPRARR
jgi:hypothetical protein